MALGALILFLAIQAVGAMPTRLKGADIFISVPTEIPKDNVLVQLNSTTMTSIPVSNFSTITAPHRVLYNQYLDALNHTSGLKFDYNMLLTGIRPKADEAATGQVEEQITLPQDQDVWSKLPLGWADFFKGKIYL